MLPTQLLKHALLFFSCSFALNFAPIPVSALNIGVETTGTSVSVVSFLLPLSKFQTYYSLRSQLIGHLDKLSKECSRKCESSFCSVPPLLRYGKYCGLLYSGCPGERPCDGLDACCMKHDQCVQAKNNDYLSQECSQTFINCMNKFQNSGATTFKGNTCNVDDVIEVINIVMKAALLAGRVLHKP